MINYRTAVGVAALLVSVASAGALDAATDVDTEATDKVGSLDQLLTDDVEALVNHLIPDHVARMSGAPVEVVSKREGRSVGLTVTLPDLGERKLSVSEDLVVSGTVPILDHRGLVDEHRDFLVWSGRTEEGDEVSVRFTRSESNTRWRTLGAHVIASRSSASWELADRNAQRKFSDKSQWQARRSPVFIEADTSEWPISEPVELPVNQPELHEQLEQHDGISVSNSGPNGFGPMPQFPVSGATEARSADIVVLAANGVSTDQALDQAAAGVTDFNVAMNNSHSAVSPINNVSVRLVAVSWLNDNQNGNIVTDLSHASSTANTIMSAFGADLAIAIYPNRWTSNGSSSNPACGGMPLLGSVGLITENIDGNCNQADKKAFAHELGHAYNGVHSHGRWRNGDRTLVDGGADDRIRFVSNPQVNWPGSSTATGTSTQNNAERIDQAANTIRNRRTYTGGSSATALGRYTQLASPVRVFDSRNNIGSPSQIVTSTPRPISLVTGGIPLNANAVAVNLTVVSPVGSGYIAINGTENFPNPVSSVANYLAGDSAKATSAIVTPGEYGVLWVTANVANTHLIVDVMGYFAPGSGNGLHIQDPVRRCDTRSAPDDPTGTCGTVPLGHNNSNRSENVITNCADGSTAAAVNITAVPVGADGYIRAAATSSDLSNTSLVNFTSTTGAISNFAIVPLSSTERFRLNAPVGNAHAIVDVMACFGAGGLDYRPLPAPVRRRDTRPGTGFGGIDFQTAGEVETINSMSNNSVPLLNVTVTDITGASFSTVHSSTSSAGIASNINYVPANVVRNNFAIADGGSNSDVRITRCGGCSGGNHLIVDQVGWFE